MGSRCCASWASPRTTCPGRSSSRRSPPAMRTIVFDNRDVGESAYADGPYEVADMAVDALGLADALGLERFHVLGVSLGGAIAQHLALAAPERVRTLTLAVRLGGQRRLRTREDAACGRRSAACATARGRLDSLLLADRLRGVLRERRAASRSSSRSCAPTRTRRSPRASCARPTRRGRHDLRGRLGELRHARPRDLRRARRARAALEAGGARRRVLGARLTVIEGGAHSLTLEKAPEFTPPSSTSSRMPPSVLEVPAVREDHRDAGRVGGLDDLRVALGAARLDDRRSRPRRPRAAARRRTGRTRRDATAEPSRSVPASRALSIASRTESTRLICPAPMPIVARSLESTIAFERTCLQTFQANSISPHSRSVGLRSVTTSIAERSSRSMSRSCTSRPPITRLRSRSRDVQPAALVVLEDAHVRLGGEDLERLLGEAWGEDDLGRTA